MERTRRVARGARARQLGGALTTRAGVWLTGAAGAAVGLVALNKVFNIVEPWWLLVAGPLALGAAGAAALSLARRRTLLDGAAEVDRRLGLKDRLATAVALAEPGGAGRREDPFVALAVADAEEAAAKVDLARAIPVRLRWHWGAWPVMTALAVVGGVLLPTWDVLSEGPRQREVAAREAEQRRQAAAEVRDAVELAQRALPERTAEAATTRELEQLRQLQAELESGKTDAESARETSARTMEQMAAHLDDQAESGRMEADATRQRLAETAGGTGDAESALTRAMRQGDLAAARQAAEALMSGLSELSPEERAGLAKDLEQLSRDLKELDERAAVEKASEPAPREGERPKAPAAAGSQPDASGAVKPPDPTIAPDLQRDLASQGLAPNQVSELTRAPDKGAAQKQLEDLGVDPETARRLAERIQQDKAEQEAQEQARKHAEDLSKAMDEAAEALREQPQPPPTEQPAGAPPEEKTPPADKQPEQRESGEQKDKPKDATGQPKDGQKTGERRQGEQQPGGKEQQGKEQQGKDQQGKDQQGGKPREGEKQPGDGAQRQPGDSGKTGDPKQGQPSGKPEAGKPAAGEQKATDPKQADGTKPASGDRAGDKQAGEKPSDAPKPDRADKPGAEQGGATGKQEQPRPQPGDKPGEGERPGDKPAGEKPTGEPKPAEGSKEDTSGKQGQPRPQPGDKPSGDSKPSETPKPDAAGNPGAKPDAKGGDQQARPEPGDKSGEQPAGAKSAGEKPGDGAKPDTGADKPQPTGKTGAQERPGTRPLGEEAAEKPGAQRGEKPGAKQPSKGDRQQPADKPTGADPQQPGEKSPDQNGQKEPGDGPPDAQSLERLMEKLKDLDGARDHAERDQRVARDLRERARQMLEKATPEQRERLERWAEQYAKEHGFNSPGDEKEDGMPSGGAGSQAGKQRKGTPAAIEPPSRTDLVDARPRDKTAKPGGQRIVSERFSDQKPAADSAGAVSHEQFQEALGHAKESAERAVSERLVPGRYDQLLRRYFDRLPAKASPAGAPPETAKDADTRK